MGAGTAPAAIAPRSACTHSGRFGPTTQTASPGFTPSAISARAVLRTTCAASLQENSRTPCFQANRDPSRAAVAKKLSMDVIADSVAECYEAGAQGAHHGTQEDRPHRLR